MRVNKLRLKPDKTEEMVVRTKPALGSGCTLMLDGVTFPPKAQVHTLGVLLDLALRLNKKATVMTRDTVHGSRFTVQLVFQVQSFLENRGPDTVICALVKLRLNYCNALNVGLPLQMAQKLQLVLNAAARVLVSTITLLLYYRSYTGSLL